MIDVGIKIDNRYRKKLVAKYQRATFEAGILHDRPHYKPVPRSRGSMLGGPVRKKSSDTRGNVSDVGETIRKTHRVDYLRAPLRHRTEQRRLFLASATAYLNGAAKSQSYVQTLLRRLIREPILLGRYGRNSRYWAKVKGFNRKLIDTGQFFRAIVAKVRTGRRRV